MNPTISIAATLAAAALVVGCSSGIRYKARPAPVLPPAVTDGGRAIYVYERRVEERDGALIATHVTRDPSGVVQLAETATSTLDYRLASYTLHANQLGHTGTVTVSGDEVAFRVSQDGRQQSRVEHQRTPVVVGPTLVGYIVEHLDELAGRTLKVRFAVLDRLETIGFELSTVSSRDDRVRVKLEPSSFLVGLVVDPTYFTFDRATRKLIRIEGLVPTKIRRGNWWKDFDARVEYRFVADRYL